MKVADRPRLNEIRAVNGSCVCVVWADGREQTVDLSPILMSYKVFRTLRRDRTLFKSVRLADDGRTVVWTEDIDMAVETVARLPGTQ